MKYEKSFGQELIEAVKEALENPVTVRILKPKFDIKGLRKELHLTQKEFSEVYHINLETLKNWEQGEKSPDTTGIAYLTCIAKAPEEINRILNS
ncbi:MAG: transcriptional regulator [Gammaproteobacteria bacterium]|jgi:DNA-binding transcriptional regulator YiaG|nr:transcriptional regulator [Gammaproteobacteria bacterium]